MTLRERLAAFTGAPPADADIKALILLNLNEMALAINERNGAHYLNARDDWRENAGQSHANGKPIPPKPSSPRTVYVKPDLFALGFDGKLMFEPEPDFAPPPPPPPNQVVIGVQLGGRYYQCPATDTAAEGREYTDVRGTFVKTKNPWGFYWVLFQSTRP